MNDKIKTITVIICLSFTCFLTQCQGCTKTDKVTHKPIPNQVIYSISCGFPFPYFDVHILNTSENKYYYKIKNSYIVSISIAVNLLTIIAGYFFILFLLSKKLIRLNKFLLITSVLTILFSLSLFVNLFPDFITSLLIYLYVYPVMIINALLEFLKIDLRDNIISVRIYLILLIVIIYHFLSLTAFIRNKLSVK